MAGREYDLEVRLMNFSADIIRITERMIETRAGNHIGGQLLRSGTSPYLNHGEAEAAEPQKDFIHMLKVCLKELRETERCLKLTKTTPLIEAPPEVDPILKEVDELIRIFVASIRTANSNSVKEERDEYGV